MLWLDALCIIRYYQSTILSRTWNYLCQWFAETYVRGGGVDNWITYSMSDLSGACFSSPQLQKIYYPLQQQKVKNVKRRTIIIEFIVVFWSLCSVCIGSYSNTLQLFAMAIARSKKISVSRMSNSACSFSWQSIDVDHAYISRPCLIGRQQWFQYT